MGKYFRPLTDILDEIVAEIPRSIQILSVQNNPNNTQTISACDILYAQTGFNIIINNLSYKIIDFSQQNETLTIRPNFKGEMPDINISTIFDLYPIYFFHGTPVSTQTELNKLNPASRKTPMIWLWENYKEQTFRDEMIERIFPGLQLFGLTQPPMELSKMLHEDIRLNCVDPMRRALELIRGVIERRTDLFYSDELQMDFEEYTIFGIMARNKGADRSVHMDKLSGVGTDIDLQLYFKESCPCPPIRDLRQFDDSFSDSFL